MNTKGEAKTINGTDDHINGRCAFFVAPGSNRLRDVLYMPYTIQLLGAFNLPLVDAPHVKKLNSLKTSFSCFSWASQRPRFSMRALWRNNANLLPIE